MYRKYSFTFVNRRPMFFMEHLINTLSVMCYTPQPYELSADKVIGISIGKFDAFWLRGEGRNK